MLPALLEQARFQFSGLLATHGDWDHLLGRLAFPGAALGVAETTSARLRAHPGAAQRALRDFDERHYLTRPAPLALGSVEALPVPGYCALGERELELHAADGHTVDGMAVWIPWASVLVCGDYLLSPGRDSRRRRPSIDGYLGDAGATRAAGRARPTHVVPGHGGPIDAPPRPSRCLREDRTPTLEGAAARRRSAAPERAAGAAAAAPTNARAAATRHHTRRQRRAPLKKLRAGDP